jgi:hypothetical protein
MEITEGFSSQGGTPKVINMGFSIIVTMKILDGIFHHSYQNGIFHHIPFLDGILHEINHPAIKGYPHDLGNLHMEVKDFDVHQH